MASWLLNTRFSFLIALTALAIGSNLAHAGPILETSLSSPGARDSYRIVSGSFDPNKSEELIGWLKSTTEGLSYFEVNSIEPSRLRTPQSTSSPAASWIKKLTGKITGAVVKPVIRIKEKANPLLKDPENRVILTFTLIAGSVDGVVNTGVLMIFQDMPLESSLGVGAVIGLLSASWSALTPRIAKVLNEDPSLVDRLTTQKQSGLYETSKFFEGLLKWGIIEIGVTSVVAAVSHYFGATHYASATEWALSSFEAAVGVVAGLGVLDYSLSVELNQQRLKNEGAEAYRKALIKNYAFGTLAASVATLGSLGSLLGYDFSEILMQGMLGTGLINLARIKWPIIQAFAKKLAFRCNRFFLPQEALDGPPPGGYENWGSE